MGNNTLLGLVAILVTGMIGLVLVNVFDTGVELKCPTNKPIGWEIDNTFTVNGVTIYSVHCPYKTKEWTYANCSSLRSTGSYENYGCNEVIIETIEPEKDPEQKEQDSAYVVKCKFGQPCEQI